MKLPAFIAAELLLAASIVLVYYSPASIVRRARKRGYTVPPLTRGAIIREKVYAS